MSAQAFIVLPVGTLGINDPRDGTLRILKKAGIHTCPECDSIWDLKSNARSPIQDDCGHVKCNSCMRKTFGQNALCTQCVQGANAEAPMTKPLESTRPQVKAIDVLKEKLGKPIHPPIKIRLQSRNPNENLQGDTKQGDTKQGALATSIDNSTRSTLVNKTRPYQPEPLNNGDSQSQGEWRIVSNDRTVALKPIKPPTSSSEQHGSGACAVTSTTRTIRQVKKKLTIPAFINVIPSDGTSPELYHCRKCGKTFKTKAHVKYHEFCTQPDQRPWVCNICNKSFSSKSHFEYHQRLHTGERPFKCPECGKGFNQQGKLTRHSRVHTGQKPFVCTDCGKGFSSSERLKIHWGVHTGELLLFPCPYCDKQFTATSNLKNHMFSHTGEGPFECEICRKRFGLKWALSIHMRTHSATKPYACDQCPRKFAFPKDLKRHKVIHTGERPFPCHVCGQAFQRKDNLDRHIRHTHAIYPKNGVAVVVSHSAESQASTAQTALEKTGAVISNPDGKDTQTVQISTSDGNKNDGAPLSYNEFSPGKLLLCQICDITLDSRTRYESHLRSHTDLTTVTFAEDQILNEELPMQPPDFTQEFIVPFVETSETDEDIEDTAERSQNSIQTESFHDCNEQPTQEEQAQNQLDFSSMNGNVMVKVEKEDDIEILWENISHEHVNRANVPERENISSASAKAIPLSQTTGELVVQNNTDVMERFKDKAITFVYDNTGSVANVMLS